MTLLKKTRAHLVPLSLGAMAFSLLLLAGCGKEEPASSAVDPSSPESYMKDPEFRGKLAKQRKEHLALTRARNEIAEKMRQMIEARKAELKTEDLKVVRAALEKDPAWRELYVQCTNANAKVRAQRTAQLDTVRSRLAPKQKTISK